MSFVFSVKRLNSLFLTTLPPFPQCILRCLTLLLSNCQQDATFLGHSLCRSIAASLKVITNAKRHDKLTNLKAHVFLSTTCCIQRSLLLLHVPVFFVLQTMKLALTSYTSPLHGAGNETSHHCTYSFYLYQRLLWSQPSYYLYHANFFGILLLFIL
jgi:hypothetical protein